MKLGLSDGHFDLIFVLLPIVSIFVFFSSVRGSLFSVHILMDFSEYANSQIIMLLARRNSIVAALPKMRVSELWASKYVVGVHAERPPPL